MSYRIDDNLYISKNSELEQEDAGPKQIYAWCQTSFGNYGAEIWENFPPNAMIKSEPKYVPIPEHIMGKIEWELQSAIYRADQIRGWLNKYKELKSKLTVSDTLPNSP